MAFDILSWATGFALTTGIKHLYEKTFKGLPSKLNDIIDRWSKELPRYVQFNPEALFVEIEGSSDSTNFPALADLQRELESLNIPNKDKWFNALFERWDYVRKTQGADAHPFFVQPPKVAEQQLRIVAHRLEMECKKDEDLFRVTTQNLLKDIQKSLKVLETKRSASDVTEEAVWKALDNDLIYQIGIAGYITDRDGVKRAIYFDKDDLYVHREAQEKIIITEVKKFAESPSSNNKWISIIGDAGHGKSSLIWYLYNFFREYIDQEVFCVLAQLSGKEIYDKLDLIISKTKSNAIILFDTLDILVGFDDPKLISIINLMRKSGHLLITTSRRQEIKKLALRSDMELELDRYTVIEAKQAIRKYINVCYPEMRNHEKELQFENVWNLLDSQRKIQELDLQPLILSMLFQAYAPSDIPQDVNTQKVYEQFWSKQVLEDRTVIAAEDKFIRSSFSCLLAYSIIFLNDGHADTYPIDKLQTVWEKRYKTAFPFRTLESLISSGVIHWARGHTHLRFFHQTFLEYVSAIYLRLLDQNEFNDLLSILYDDFKSNIYMRIPILKQIAVQDFYQGEGIIWKSIMNKLSEIDSLYSLQVSLEISGKITDDQYPLEICKKWIAMNPSRFATTVHERVQFYSRSKVKLALEFLEQCLGSHEEIAIYNLCGKKLAVMDASSVRAFLHRRLTFIKSLTDGDDQKAYFKEAVIDSFRYGAHESINDLFDLFPYIKSGQKTGIINSLSSLLTTENAKHIAHFCEKTIDFIIEDEKGEVRYSYINLLSRLNEFVRENIITLCQAILISNKWRQNEIAAIFAGRLVGKFLLNQDLVRSFLANLNSKDPLYRLLST